MSGVIVIVIVILGLFGVLGAFAYVTYQRNLRKAKAVERGLKMVPLLIHLPPPSDDTEAGNRDLREVMREKTSQAEVLYNLIAGTATEGFKSKFYGQRHIGFEIVATNGLIHYYAAVPVNMVSVVQNAIISSYPGARVEEAEDHNIFNKDGKLIGTMGGEIVLKAESAYPIANYTTMERDPMEALLSALSGIAPGSGAAVQILLRPADKRWVKRSEYLSRKKRKIRHSGTMEFGVKDLAKAAVKAPSERHSEAKPELSNLELSVIEAIENKTKQPGFEVLIRVLVSTDSVATSQALVQKIATAFALFEQPGLNGFKYLPASNAQGLVTAFILRFFPPPLKQTVLNTEEIATLFHIPDSQFIPTSNVERQQSKQVDGPPTVPANGLLFGHNEFRGVKKEIRLSDEDRRRHTYIIGQTGTGKSTMLENLVVQDLMAGKGFAFIDPHGDTAEKFMGMIPKERAEDVIYFNPGDMADPLGLNLFEFTDSQQKDFLIQESLNMLYKIYDPDKTGIIGPRFEQWYRNAALTLMADPNGATFIEIPKVFTDTEYLKNKFKYLKDPTVIEFWTKEMGQTSDYHKSEMLGFFVSKFGAFQQNEMMRNIIGQTQSAFNMRDVMDKKKILIVNLSKGKIGELNSKLLGMMFVIKFQAAAMSRGDVPEADRNDFCLYVDEFQNFSTDSFASILSEARKYRLNLIVANQFIGQLTPEIRDAVFGNIGTIISHRTGPEDAEFMVKQFAPLFDARDLVNIPNWKSVVKMLIGGLPTQPFSMNDLPPVADSNPELAEAMKELSAAKYGRPRAQVESEITGRLTNKPVAAAPATPIPVAPAAAPVANSVAPTSAPTTAAPVAQAVAAPAQIEAAPIETAPAPIAPAPAPNPAPAPAPQGAAPAPSSDTLRFSDIKKPSSDPQPAPAAAATTPTTTSEVMTREMMADAQHEIDALLSTSLLESNGDAKPAAILPDPTTAPAPKPVPTPEIAVPAATPVEATPPTSEAVQEKVVVRPFVPRGDDHTVDHGAQASKAATTDAPVSQAVVETPALDPVAVAAPIEEPVIHPEVTEPQAPIVTTDPIAQTTLEEPVTQVEPAASGEIDMSGTGITLVAPTPEPAVAEPTVAQAPSEELSISELSSTKSAVSSIATGPSVVAAPIAAPVTPTVVEETIPAVLEAPEAPVDAIEATPDPAIPTLAPGEIFVDDNGVVHQG